MSSIMRRLTVRYQELCRYWLSGGAGSLQTLPLSKVERLCFRAGAADHESRADHQSESREGARSHFPLTLLGGADEVIE
jgi:hypothetical protein